MAKASYYKVQLQKVGPFQTINVQPHTVVLGKEKVPITVSVHRVTAALELKEN